METAVLVTDLVDDPFHLCDPHARQSCLEELHNFLKALTLLDEFLVIAQQYQSHLEHGFHSLQEDQV